MYALTKCQYYGHTLPDALFKCYQISANILIRPLRLKVLQHLRFTSCQSYNKYVLFCLVQQLQAGVCVTHTSFHITKSGLGNDRPAGHTRPARYLNMARELVSGSRKKYLD